MSCLLSRKYNYWSESGSDNATGTGGSDKPSDLVVRVRSGSDKPSDLVERVRSGCSKPSYLVVRVRCGSDKKSDLVVSELW